jgi:hypothetical protein
LAAAADQAAVNKMNPASGSRRLDCGIHARGARTDHQHIGFNVHWLCQ